MMTAQVSLVFVQSRCTSTYAKSKSVEVREPVRSDGYANYNVLSEIIYRSRSKDPALRSSYGSGLYF
jgi:hypothetical protein